MSVKMAEVRSHKRDQSPYVNISPDMNAIADSIGQLSLESSKSKSGKPQPAERTQVTVRTQERNKVPEESERKKSDKKENDYINVNPRTPINGEMTFQCQQEVNPL